jgi:hypothetical protein
MPFTIAGYENNAMATRPNDSWGILCDRFEQLDYKPLGGDGHLAPFIDNLE